MTRAEMCGLLRAGPGARLTYVAARAARAVVSGGSDALVFVLLAYDHFRRTLSSLHCSFSYALLRSQCAATLCYRPRLRYDVCIA